jgi:hypothetical protein
MRKGRRLSTSFLFSCVFKSVLLTIEIWNTIRNFEENHRPFLTPLRGCEDGGGSQTQGSARASLHHARGVTTIGSPLRGYARIAEGLTCTRKPKTAVEPGSATHQRGCRGTLPQKRRRAAFTQRVTESNHTLRRAIPMWLQGDNSTAVVRIRCLGYGTGRPSGAAREFQRT